MSEFYACDAFDFHRGSYCKKILWVPLGQGPTKGRCSVHDADDDLDDSDANDEFQSDGGEQELTMDCKPLVRQSIYFLLQEYFDFLFSDRVYGH
ncbi:hypothetical protein BG000_008271 [Podila horticola]|nr:hypothetical protein BG000_008271 [Podila horticola]